MEVEVWDAGDREGVGKGQSERGGCISGHACKECHACGRCEALQVMGMVWCNHSCDMSLALNAPAPALA